MKNGPPIAEAVGLLGKFSPNTLSKLRQSLPEGMGPLLEVGGIAGLSDALLKPRAEVAKKALDEIAVQCARSVEAARNRLKLSRSVRLVGEIAAVVGSASVLGSGVSGASSLLIPSGVVALVGSLSAAIAEFALKLPQDGMGTLFDTYANLGESRFEANRISSEISIHLNVPTLDEAQEAQLASLTGEANDLCRKALKLFTLVLKG